MKNKNILGGILAIIASLDGHYRAHRLVPEIGTRLECTRNPPSQAAKSC